MKVGDEELGQISRVIRHQAGGLSLNGLSKILAKIGISRLRTETKGKARSERGLRGI